MSISSQTGSTTPPFLRKVATHAALVFVSTLAIQVTTFVILASAGLVLDTAPFARLSLIVAAAMLASALFELGLNVSSTKFYGDTRDDAFLRTAFLTRLLCVPLGCVLGLAVALTGHADIGLGIGLGAALNLWNGMRASDLARQDYESFVATSLSFAGLRGVAGLGALYATRDPVLTALASYALPIVCVALSHSARFAVEAFGPRRPVADMLWYATHVYLNALTFIAIPYVPQFFIASRLDATAVGTYALILTLTGPISLLVYSLRSVLLPKMLGGASSFEDMMWSRRGLLTIAALCAAAAAGGVLLGNGLDILYGHRFPEIGSAFIVFFVGFSASAIIGFYSLSVHTQGVPHISTAVGVVKFVVLLVLLTLTHRSLFDVVVLTSLVMVAGEVVLAGLLGVRRKDAAS
jgi:O-antigen/teichoic acid export membrane protein